MPHHEIDTGRVRKRRAIRLQTVDDLLAEVERVTAAADAGEVRPLGNWSPAQVLWHIGKLIELSFDGFSWRYRRCSAAAGAASFRTVAKRYRG